MNIEMTNIVTLSDDIQYVVVSKAEYNGKYYYLFADINDNKNIKFLCEDGNELVEINPDDEELVNNVLPILSENVKEIIPESVLEEIKKTFTPEMIENLKEQAGE